MTEDADRLQLLREIVHWRDAVDALADLDVVRRHPRPGRASRAISSAFKSEAGSRSVVQALAADTAALQAGVVAGKDTHTLRVEVLRLRGRYTQVETILDFYGDAVNTVQLPALVAVLRGLDVIAGDSLDAALKPRPRIASCSSTSTRGWALRSCVRVSACGTTRTRHRPRQRKLTRHNLGHPTALLHEVGHQAAHQTGWTGELSSALESVLLTPSRETLGGPCGGRGRARSLPTCFAFRGCGWAPLVRAR